MLVAVVALVADVAVAALPPIDNPDAVPVNPVPAPANLVAVKTPVDGTYCSFVELTYSVVIVPDVTDANNGYLADTVDVSSETVIAAAGLDHVGADVPLEVKTCPVVPDVKNAVAPALD